MDPEDDWQRRHRHREQLIVERFGAGPVSHHVCYTIDTDEIDIADMPLGAFWELVQALARRRSVLVSVPAPGVAENGSPADRHRGAEADAHGHGGWPARGPCSAPGRARRKTQAGCSCGPAGPRAAARMMLAYAHAGAGSQPRFLVLPPGPAAGTPVCTQTVFAQTVSKPEDMRVRPAPGGAAPYRPCGDLDTCHALTVCFCCMLCVVLLTMFVIHWA